MLLSVWCDVDTWHYMCSDVTSRGFSWGTSLEIRVKSDTIIRRQSIFSCQMVPRHINELVYLSTYGWVAHSWADAVRVCFLWINLGNLKWFVATFLLAKWSMPSKLSLVRKNKTATALSIYPLQILLAFKKMIKFAPGVVSSFEALSCQFLLSLEIPFLNNGSS